jgi:hypothetical protein
MCRMAVRWGESGPRTNLGWHFGKYFVQCGSVSSEFDSFLLRQCSKQLSMFNITWSERMNFYSSNLFSINHDFVWRQWHWLSAAGVASQNGIQNETRFFKVLTNIWCFKFELFNTSQPRWRFFFKSKKICYFKNRALPNRIEKLTCFRLSNDQIRKTSKIQDGGIERLQKIYKTI